MMVWGARHAAVRLAESNSALGVCMALQLGLFSGVFETIQVMRDADEDAAGGVRTTAVVLGKARTLRLARGLMALEHLRRWRAAPGRRGAERGRAGAAASSEQRGRLLDAREVDLRACLARDLRLRVLPGHERRAVAASFARRRSLTTLRAMREGKSEVLIVGAGPTDAAAGIVLARAGLDVCVVDRARFPARQGLRRRGLERRHGADRPARRADAVERRPACARAARCRRVPRRAHASSATTSAPGYIVPRYHLDDCSAPRARELGRAARAGLRGLRAHARGDRVTGAHGPALRWSAELVIAADGYGSVGLAALGQPGAARPLPGGLGHRVLPQRRLPRRRGHRGPLLLRRTCRTATAGSSPRSTASRTSACTCARMRTRAAARN